MIKIMKLFAITLVVTLLLASGLAQARTEPFQTESKSGHLLPGFPTEPIPPPKHHHDAKISVEPIPGFCPPGLPGCPPGKVLKTINKNT
ncbi:hypothetical protein N665_1692s0009 [Sinapis alba]|nr:hypothetical protein N665_1692s0009 [Sinapis alba]